VLDSWYHLNRTDQIIGRAIRYCSHSALRRVETRLGLPAMSMNNCLIYLHVTHLLASERGPALETADMYAYRLAIRKAQKMGLVQRLLKRHAWDCNLELEAITFVGLPLRAQVDAQGRDRRSRDAEGNELDGYSIDDQNYTTYCDYQVCNHACALTLDSQSIEVDDSTYGIADARRFVLQKHDIVRNLFREQIMVPEQLIRDIFGDMPWELASEALLELLDGRRFRLTRPDGVSGFLIKKNGYVVFQPERIPTETPISLRYARGIQLKRHVYEPRLPVWGREAPTLPKFKFQGSTPAVAPAASATSAAAPTASAAAEATTILKLFFPLTR
jgi:hypothetical protein